MLRELSWELSKFSIFFHYCNVLMMGITHGLLYGYLVILLEEYHASKFLMGFSYTLSDIMNVVGNLASKQVYQLIGYDAAILLSTPSICRREAKMRPRYDRPRPAHRHPPTRTPPLYPPAPRFPGASHTPPPAHARRGTRMRSR